MNLNEIKNVRNPVMCLITKAQLNHLLGAGSRGDTPIIKLFGGPLTWLVTGIDEDGILWGWADIGLGCVEFGTLVHILQLPTLKAGPVFLERDYYFKHVFGTKYGEMTSLVGI